MIRLLQITLLLFSALTTTFTLARDTELFLPISEAINSPDFQDRLDPDIRLYFGTQSYPEPEQRLGEFVSNKKTNGVGKSDVASCQWVLLSALLSLQERALSEGGNAIVDIVSYYKKDEYSSNEEYECHAGSIMSGVALKGRVVKLP